MIIAFAIIPDQLDVIEGLLDKSIFFCAQLLTCSSKIHWIFDDEGIIG